MKEISLCMIVKDEEDVIGRCLDSVKDLVDEIIVVDTGSQDKTKQIISEYTDKVFEISAGRCAAARNKGLDEAKGKWLLFMDDDDWFMNKDAFLEIAEVVGEHDEDILAFGFYWKKYGNRMNSPERLYTAVWNKAWRREFVEQIGARFPDWAHSDDEGFSRLTHHRAKIAYLDKYLYYYNFMREGSLTWQIENKLIDGSIPPAE